MKAKINPARTWQMTKFLFKTNKLWYICMTLAAPLIIALKFFGFELLDALFSRFYEWFQPLRYDEFEHFAFFVSAAMVGVMAASVFHPLINRRKRLTVLTLPANNIEKFLAMMGLSVASIVVSACLTCVVVILVRALCNGWDDAFYIFKVLADTEWRPSGFVVFYVFLAIPATITLLNSRLFRYNLIPSAILAFLMFAVLVSFLETTYHDVYHKYPNLDWQKREELMTPYYNLCGCFSIAWTVGALVLTYLSFKWSALINYLNRK